MNYAEDSDRILAVQYRQCVVSSYFTGKVWHGTPKSRIIVCKTWHCFFFFRFFRCFLFLSVFSYLDQWEMCFPEQGGVFCLDICQHNNYTLVWHRNVPPSLRPSGQLHFQPWKVFAYGENQLKWLITMENTVWKSGDFIFSTLCTALFFFHNSF